MKLGIALSGGGTRGIAHAGVLKALEENNVKIDIIGGTSSGALIASLYAMGFSPYYIYILFKRYSKKLLELSSAPIISGISNFILNKKVNLSGLNSGEDLEKVYNDLALKKGIKIIKDINSIPLVIPTVDVENSKKYVITNVIPEKIKNKEKYITDITVGKAVRASSSFPAIFCPCEYKNHKFLDGGILDNIPVIEVKKQGATKVIAVNFKADDITEESNVMDIAMRTIDIMGNKISEDSLKQSDFILTVETDKTGLLDVEKIDSCYRYGYRATINNIDKIKEIIYKN